MWAIAHSTAGELNGDDPTYWTKWSSICATRSSGTWRRMVPATVAPMRRLSTSRMVAAFRLALRSIVSARPSTDRQKKKR
jgi:hypothetical protein